MNATVGQAPDSAETVYRSLSFWLDTAPGSLSPRPALDADLDVDVVIVGGGYTGLWTAYYLSRHAPDLDIVVLESDIAGHGASGRNGGWCSAYLSGIDHWLDNPDTREGALRLQRLMFDTVSEIGAVCKAEGIDAHFEQAGHVEAGVNPHQMKRIARELEAQRSLGFGDDFVSLSAEALRERVRIDGALGGLYTPHCAAIHPARLVRGLADHLASRGVRLFEQSRVTSLGPGFASTPSARVRAQRVLLATEGYTGGIGGLSRKLVPVHSMMVATEPLTDAQLEACGVTARFCFNNLDHIVTYGQLTADRRIAFGSRGSYHYGSGIRQFDAADPDFDFTRSKLIELFPGLHGVQFTHAWGGCMGVSRSLHPVVSFDARRGFGWAGGYFGNGVAATHLAGRTLADLVLSRQTERVDTPWVNAPGERHLRQGLWEPEPLRWLGVRSRLQWMGWTDRLERADSPWASPFNQVLESVFP